MNNHITENVAHYGGGISARNFSICAILQNKIAGNSADWGAGIYVGNADGWIEGNVIEGNNAGLYFIELDAGIGGGIRTVTSSAALVNNLIYGNSAFGSVRNGRGGGLSIELKPASLFTGNTVTGNQADGAGGGIALFINVFDPQARKRSAAADSLHRRERSHARRYLCW